jgi:hypothetical protein
VFAEACLTIFNIKVKKARSLLDGTRTPFEQSETNIALPGNVEPYETETPEDDCPWEISDDSNDSGSEADSPTDMNHHDYSQNVINDNNEAPTTEIGQVSKSTKLIIECLYKLPLRKLAPIDRVKGFSGRDMSLYQHFDILYVRDKFPHAEHYLVDRLGKLISRRRQLLEYRTTHAERLRPPVASQKRVGGQHMVIPEGSRNDSSLKVTRTQNNPLSTKDSYSLGEAFDDLPSQITKATVQSPAEAVNSLDALYPPSVTESRMSTASEYTENHKLQVPPRPVNEAGEPLIQFQCPYCGIAKCILREPSRAWESHVLRDLQPYVCTFQDCDMFDYMFVSREAWFTHELELHRAKWSCNTCPSEANTDSPYRTFETKEGFMSHMTLVHKLSKPKLKRSTEAFRHPSSKVDRYCCLCGKHAQKLKSHLGRHMEVMALFALPRPSLQDTGSSGKALANRLPGSSRSLPSESGHDSGSRSNPADDNNPTTAENHPSYHSVPKATLSPELLQPKTPDPSSDPHLVSATYDLNRDRFPKAVSDMSPLDARDILQLNLESIVSSTSIDSAPPPPPPSDAVPSPTAAMIRKFYAKSPPVSVSGII